MQREAALRERERALERALFKQSKGKQGRTVFHEGTVIGGSNMKVSDALKLGEEEEEDVEESSSSEESGSEEGGTMIQS